jgi:arylsulfatase B
MNHLLTLLLLFATVNTYSQRNAILIIADDLGTDYCGFYEDHNDTTALPNIRRLLSK